MIKNRKKNRMKVRWKKKWMYVKYFAYLHDEVIYNTRLAKKKKKENWLELCYKLYNYNPKIPNTK